MEGVAVGVALACVGRTVKPLVHTLAKQETGIRVQPQNPQDLPPVTYAFQHDVTS